MDNFENVKRWAESLQYQGTIPDSFKSICNNPCTSFIWQQLLTQIRPKEEVRQIRYNNLQTRLQSGDETLTGSTYPMKEIELFRKKQKLQRQIKEVEDYIAEKEVIARTFSNEHKISAFKRRHIKQLIDENKSKRFLLEKKAEAFRKEIAQTEENLTFFQNLTPTESKEDESDVGNRLRKCVEKIETSLSKHKIKATACNNRSNNLFVTPQKSSTAASGKSLADHSFCEDFKTEISNEVKCLDDGDIRSDLETLLHQESAQSMLNVIVTDVNVLGKKLLGAISARSETPKAKSTDGEMSRIYVTQIENELHTLKNMKEIERLKAVVKEKENDIDNIFKRSNLSPLQYQEAEELHLLLKKRVRLTALCDCTEAQLFRLRGIKDAKRELDEVNGNIARAQQELVDKMRDIDHQLDLYRKISKAMMSYREETHFSVKKLNQFIYDLRWTAPLTHGLHTKEIETFRDFPLEYNRRINTGKDCVYVRDVMRKICFDIDSVDRDTLEMLLRSIDNPYDSPHKIIYDLIQKEMMLSAEESLVQNIAPFDYKKFDIVQLRKEESFVETLLEKYEKLRRNDSRDFNRDIKTMNEMAKLWLELPFSDYVHPGRVYEGKPLKHYQKIYDNLYDSIKTD